MKFTKDDANKALVSKLTEKGDPLKMSERSVSELLDATMPVFANDDTSLDTFVESTFTVFNTANKNVMNDVSLKAKEVQAKYDAEIAKLQEALKAKENTVDKTKENNNSTKVDDDKKNEAENPALQEIIKKLEKLEQERELQKAEKVITEKRNSVVDKLKKAGIKSKELIDGYLKITTINKDTDVDAVSKSLIETYNLMRSSTTDTNPVGGGKGNKKTDYGKQFEFTKKIVDKI